MVIHMTEGNQVMFGTRENKFIDRTFEYFRISMDMSVSIRLAFGISLYLLLYIGYQNINKILCWCTVIHKDLRGNTDS